MSPQSAPPDYSEVLTSEGITCDVDYENHPIRPTLAQNGHFFCKCTTDMSCILTNPHIDEFSDAITLQNVANAPKGTTCKNPIPWNEARAHIGKTLVVAGPLMKVTQRENVKGNPTWIEIGGSYPSDQRLMIIIWGQQKSNFPTLKTTHLEGKNVCVIGRILNYRGVPQIELTKDDEFMIIH